MTENSFEQIKRMMKIIGGKAIIVEDGKPSFVIINTDEYLAFDSIANSTEVESETDLIEKINKDITIWKNKQKEREIKQMEKDFENRKRMAGNDEAERKSREIEIV